MEIVVSFLKIIYGGFFCFAGIMHIIKSNFFKHFIPDFLPKKLVNYIVGILEFSVGVGLFFLETVKPASLGIIILLIIFLPIHIWDVTKKRPAIGSKKLQLSEFHYSFYCCMESILCI